jgi:hypothetical protein
MILQMEDCIDVVKVLWPDLTFFFSLTIRAGMTGAYLVDSTPKV